ncbi:hypothetical protein RB598_005122 [Gaeumannomyces tritici]
MPGRNMKRPAGSMSHPHVNSASDSAPAPATTPALELLACVICRDKKLRCGREGGACGRCAKAGIECVYPESRRRVTVRRNNAQALEARLAQVEGMLRDTAKSKRPAETRAKPDASGDNTRDIQQDEIPSQAFDDLADDGFFPQQPESDMGLGLDDFPGHGGPSGFGSDLAADDNMFDAQLMGQGMFESIPPLEMIEDLHNWYFFNQQDIVPMLHQARYLQAFHSAPHMRPPMCLQYALWAVAANGHPRYQSYCDVFYRRARQYLEADELRGVGEHFITVPHAQAWIFVATYEARCLMLTRAAMSCARAVRLCNLMGLHRLDDPEYEMQMMPTILPAQSWLELEERRRTFWAAFCVNSHVSIYSGWPGIIDTTTISTDLPCPEDAYERGREEQKMGKLPSLFTDGKMTYSPLCSAVGVCHIFNLILAHVNRARAGDGGGDLEHGAFWRRHREIDNLLLGGFMSLPACRSRPCAGASNHPHHRRRPGHLDWQLGGPMHVRLNLHASVICLHMAAIDRAEAHGLAADVGHASRARVLMSAHEIVNITHGVVAASSAPPPPPPPPQTAKAPTTSYIHRTPLAALALYCAAMVYMMLIKDSDGGGDGGSNTPSSTWSSSPELWVGCREKLDYIMRRAEAVSATHPVARAFLLQLALDLEHHGIPSGVSVSPADLEGVPRFTHKIPILVPTPAAAASRRTAAAGAGAAHHRGPPPPPEWLPFVRPLRCGKSTSSQWAVVASRSRGPGFVEDDGGGDGPASGATTAAAAAAAATPSTVPSGSFAQQSLSPPNGDHVGGKRRRLDARQGRSPQTAPDLTTTMAALPHRGSPSGSGCGGLGNLGSGLDAYCILDDGGLGWTEADMDALVREFVQVNQDAGDAEVASNGGQPWGAFNF